MCKEEARGDYKGRMDSAQMNARMRQRNGECVWRGCRVKEWIEKGEGKGNPRSNSALKPGNW